MHDDPYRAAAGAYDLFAAPYRAAQQAALAEALPHFQPEVGAILDIGAGSGTAAVEILERLPEAHVLALEPSATMRALLLGRHHRRHSSLGYLTPAEYTRQCTHQMETDDSQNVRTE